jgi:hypothetical protein
VGAGMCWLGLSTTVVSRRVIKCGRSASVRVLRSILLYGLLSATFVPSMRLTSRVQQVILEPFDGQVRVDVSRNGVK